jgi:transposase
VTTTSEAVRSSTEVPEKAHRRRFNAEYKQRILREADACKKPGELGALLRREGLYSSHLAAWRAARRERGLGGLSPQKRGPKQASPVSAMSKKRVEQLERENRRLKARAERAEALVALQKKVAALLGNPLTDEDES